MVFIRFSTDEYLTRFQMEGQIYLNSIQNFAKGKDVTGRDDEYENICEQFHSENDIIKIKFLNKPDSEFKHFKYENLNLKFNAPEHFINIFCLYAIKFTDYKIGEPIIIPDKMKEMDNNTHCLIIANGGEFIRRLHETLKRKNYHFKTDFVEYIDFSTYTGKKTVFQKPIEYKYQREFRIAIQNTSCEPIELFLENIEDISYKIPISKLKDLSFDYM
jgi:hypothetical protein